MRLSTGAVLRAQPFTWRHAAARFAEVARVESASRLVTCVLAVPDAPLAEAAERRSVTDAVDAFEARSGPKAGTCSASSTTT